MSDDNHSDVPSLPPPAVLRERIDDQRTRIFQAQGIVNLAQQVAGKDADLSDIEMALQAVSALLSDVDMKLDWDELLKVPETGERGPKEAQS